MRFIPSAVVALGLLNACSGDSNGTAVPSLGSDSGSGGLSGSGSGGIGGRASGGSVNGGGGSTATGGTTNGGAGGAQTGGATNTGGNADTGGGANLDAGTGGTASGSGGTDAGSDSGSAGGTLSTGGTGNGGTSTDSGTGTGGAVTPVTIDVVAGGTSFKDYGKLRVAFSEAVDASTLTIGLSPASPAALAVTAVAAVDATTVDATLAYYHLPRDYQITVSGKLQDGKPFTASGTISGLNNGSRLAFITKQIGTGNFKSWPNAPASATTGLEAADGICTAEATAAGFKGTFAAYLSAKNAYDAGCRMLGLTGTVSGKCGQASMPVDHAPWLAVNGMPIANGATAVMADAWDLPLPYSADGTQPFDALVWMGTNTGAVSDGSDCTGWTTTTGFTSMAIFLDQYLLSYDGGSSCSDNRSLACFQVGGTFFGPSTLHHVAGRRVFVTSGKLSGAMSYASKAGVAAADALCADEATAAGYANASSFHAYLGTTTADAMCHVLGKTGTVGTKCGLAAYPADVSWRRADDTPVGTVANLIANQLTAPIIFSADGTRHGGDRPWTGTQGGGSTQQNCTDWGSNTGSGYVGAPRTTSSGWAFYSTGSCGTPAPVYCFEQ